MAIPRKRALDRINELIGHSKDQGIEAHIQKLTRRGSQRHILAELEAKLNDIERLAECTGWKTQMKIVGQVQEWRRRITEAADVDQE